MKYLLQNNCYKCKNVAECISIFKVMYYCFPLYVLNNFLSIFIDVYSKISSSTLLASHNTLHFTEFLIHFLFSNFLLPIFYQGLSLLISWISWHYGGTPKAFWLWKRTALTPYNPRCFYAQRKSPERPHRYQATTVGFSI